MTLQKALANVLGSVGAKKELECVDMHERLSALGLAKFFPVEAWPVRSPLTFPFRRAPTCVWCCCGRGQAALPVRELATKLRAQRKHNPKAFVFCELKKYAIVWSWVAVLGAGVSVAGSCRHVALSTCRLRWTSIR